MKTYLLASLAALALATAALAPYMYITRARFRDPGMPEALKKKPPAPRFECPDGMVPGDPIECWPLDLSTVQTVPVPKSSTNVACTVLHGGTQLGTIDRDGKIEWYWADDLFNPHMRAAMDQMCQDAWLKARQRPPWTHPGTGCDIKGSCGDFPRHPRQLARGDVLRPAPVECHGACLVAIPPERPPSPWRKKGA